MNTNSQQLVLDIYETVGARKRVFLWNCRIVAEELALKTSDGIITIDEVRKACPLPEDIDGRIYGAVFKQDDWIALGFTQTLVKSSHGRLIRKFLFKGHPNYNSSLSD